jgi:hypothetical protein
LQKPVRGKFPGTIAFVALEYQGSVGQYLGLQQSRAITFSPRDAAGGIAGKRNAADATTAQIERVLCGEEASAVLVGQDTSESGHEPLEHNHRNTGAPQKVQRLEVLGDW